MLPRSPSPAPDAQAAGPEAAGAPEADAAPPEAGAPPPDWAELISDGLRRTQIYVEVLEEQVSRGVHRSRFDATPPMQTGRPLARRSAASADRPPSCWPCSRPSTKTPASSAWRRSTSLSLPPSTAAPTWQRARSRSLPLRTRRWPRAAARAASLSCWARGRSSCWRACRAPTRPPWCSGSARPAARWWGAGAGCRGRCCAARWL